MAGYDLHMHSVYSDGTLTPAELLSQAVKEGLDGIALTDHDTVDGLEDAASEARRQQVCFIPGVEITTDYGKQEAHILGYNIDYRSPELVRKFEVIREARIRRAKQIIAKLNRHGIPLTWEQVSERTHGKFVGRPHIFKVMEDLNYINPVYRDSYFDYYLGQDGVAYVPHQEIETEEAIQLILKSGGIPVLAHPGRRGTEELIGQLVEFGLKGLEVYYPTHTPEMVDYYLKLAGQYRLYVTGGSDYHGDLGHARMGEAVVPEIGWLSNT